MSLMIRTVAALLLFALPASAEDAAKVSPTGTWKPAASDASYTDDTILIFNAADRFAAFIATRPGRMAAGSGTTTLVPVTASQTSSTSIPAASTDKLYAGSGSWILGEDGGEVVLVFDSNATRELPGSTLYVKMLLLGDELRPYPGMDARSAIAWTTWRRTE